MGVIVPSAPIDSAVSDRVLTSGSVAVVVELTKSLHQLHSNASVGDYHQYERHDQQRQVEKYRVHLHMNLSYYVRPGKQLVRHTSHDTLRCSYTVARVSILVFGLQWPLPPFGTPLALAFVANSKLFYNGVTSRESAKSTKIFYHHLNKKKNIRVHYALYAISS